MALGLFKIEGHPDRAQAKSGMAHFAGGGPAGATCGKCEHYGWKEMEKKCVKFREMAHEWGANLKKAQSACKYFQPREKSQ